MRIPGAGAGGNGKPEAAHSPMPEGKKTPDMPEDTHARGVTMNGGPKES